jgi:hypothetical protein
MREAEDNQWHGCILLDRFRLDEAIPRPVFEAFTEKLGKQGLILIKIHVTPQQ